jgi:hypothetical protein
VVAHGGGDTVAVLVAAVITIDVTVAELPDAGLMLLELARAPGGDNDGGSALAAAGHRCARTRSAHHRVLVHCFMRFPFRRSSAAPEWWGERNKGKVRYDIVRAVAKE